MNMTAGIFELVILLCQLLYMPTCKWTYMYRNTMVVLLLVANCTAVAVAAIAAGS
jgi:hypothetical protein